VLVHDGVKVWRSANCRKKDGAYTVTVLFPRPRVLEVPRVLELPRDGVVVVVPPRPAPPRFAFAPRPPRVKMACVGRSALGSDGGALFSRPRPRPRPPRLLLLLPPRAPRSRSPPLPPRGADMLAAVGGVSGMRRVWFSRCGGVCRGLQAASVAEVDNGCAGGTKKSREQS
jgi:hypothetical protein